MPYAENWTNFFDNPQDRRRRTGWRAVALVGLSIAILSHGSAHATPSITSVGVLPGDTISSVNAINTNGSVVVGAGDLHAFRWTAGGGIQDLGNLPNGLFSMAFSVTADGQAVMGVSTDDIYYRIFRWTSATGMQAQGLLPGGTYIIPLGSSSDGRFLTGAGNSNLTPQSRGFLWTLETGVQDMGDAPGWTGYEGRGVSLNGNAVTGRGTLNGQNRAFRWTSQGGLQALPLLAGHTYSQGSAISDDGQVMFGFAGPSTTSYSAMRWTTTTGAQDLGILPGTSRCNIERTCSTGSVGVGGCSAPGGNRATLWRQDIGFVDLNTYLPTLGVNLAGWILTHATGISSDGTAIIGSGQFNGQTRGFVVQGLPALCLPALISHPFSQSRCDGTTNGSFTVTAGGIGLSYQWQIQVSPNVWTNLTTHAEDLPCFHAFATLPHASGTQIGADAISCNGDSTYLVRCVISNANGSVISNTATLTYYRTGTGDIDGDGEVDGRDIQRFVATLLSAFPVPSLARCGSDLNHDGFVNIGDVGLFTQQLLGI